MQSTIETIKNDIDSCYELYSSLAPDDRRNWLHDTCVELLDSDCPARQQLGRYALVKVKQLELLDEQNELEKDIETTVGIADRLRRFGSVIIVTLIRDESHPLMLVEVEKRETVAKTVEQALTVIQNERDYAEKACDGTELKSYMFVEVDA